MRPDRFGSAPRRVGHVVRVTLPAHLAPAAAALLAGAASGTVGALPAGDGGGRVRLEAPLDPGPAGDEAAARLVPALEALERAHPDARVELEREEHLVEEDWGAVRTDRFAPFLAVPGLVLRPPWRPYAPRPGERVLVIDPGAAFGSGSHASTRLALGLLAERCAVAPPRRLLDVGTGTGVLALAGALWGAGEVVAIDTDPAALAAAQANAARNGLDGAVRVVAGGLAGAGGTYDLVVANVTAEVLVDLAGAIAPRLAPGGALVLAGILAGGQDADVEAAYERRGLRRRERREEGEWVGLLLGAQGEGA